MGKIILKKWQKTIIISLSIFLCLWLIGNQIIKTAVTISASNILGTKVHIDKLTIGILEPTVEIFGLQIYNPEDFPKGILIDINKIGTQYDLPSILEGKLHLPIVVLDLKKMVIIKNQEGLLNIDSLRIIQQEAEKEKHKEKKEITSKKRMPLLIDEARLNFGKVIVKDYTKGEIPIIHGYDIDIKNKIYKDINSIPRLVTMIMIEGVGPIGLKSAALYGASTALGVAFLPASIAGIFIGKNGATGIFKNSPDKAFDKTVDLLEKIGTITKASPETRIINAKIYGATVSVSISQNDEKKTVIFVKARRKLMPKGEIAEGVLHQISQLLKK
ncbi:MAG: hypothetical protein P9M12_00425 [Candidatus Aceula lacicola]|nr:hypothetical protein [Candidatus Aceula lacicola]